MGRKAYLRQYKKTPKDFSEFTRTRTDWDGVLRALQHNAIGGQTVTNANNVTFVTQPDTKALALLIDVAYGKQEGEGAEVIEKIKEEVTKQSSAPLRILTGSKVASN